MLHSQVIRHTCCLKQPRYFKVPRNQFLTACDFLEANVYHLSQFSKRHGSFVPGPLEARRRAAKRRIFGLAQLDGEAADSEFLAVPDPVQDLWSWKWQRPSQPRPEQKPLPGKYEDRKKPPQPKSESQQLPFSLLSWISPPGSHVETKTKEDIGSQPLVATSVTHVSGKSLAKHQKRTEIEIQRFCEELKTCQSLEEIRKAVDILGVKLHAAPIYSELAFQHMLGMRCSLEDLLDYLSDPCLNTQGTRNIERILQQHAKKPYSQNEFRVLHNWLRMQISLGILSGKQLHGLLQTMSSFNMSSSTDSPIIEICETIFEGMSSSTVFRITDLEGHTLNSLLMTVANNRFSSKSELLGLKIIDSLHASQLGKMASSIYSFVNCLLFPNDPRIETHLLEIHCVLKVLNLLWKLPRSIAIDTLAKACKFLIKQERLPSINRSLLLRNLDTWWLLLLRHDVFELFSSSAEWDKIECFLARCEIDTLCSYLRHVEHTKKCSFLLQHWYNPLIIQSGQTPSGDLNRITQRFDEGLPGLEKTMSPFVFMFQCIGKSLPTDWNSFSRLWLLLNELNMFRTLFILFDYFQRSGVHLPEKLVAREIAKYTTSCPQVAFALFQITPTLPLESCPDVANIIINDPGLHPGRALGFRLDRQEYLGVSDVYPCTAAEIRIAQAELLKRMAVAYAHAPHLFPNVSFRQVYQCYILHRRHRLGPLSVEMSAALTFAGLVRPLKENIWVSTTKLRWILNIVQQVEGEDCAARIDELASLWRGDVIRENQGKMSVERRQIMDESRPWYAMEVSERQDELSEMQHFDMEGADSQPEQWNMKFMRIMETRDLTFTRDQQRTSLGDGSDSALAEVIRGFKDTLGEGDPNP